MTKKVDPGVLPRDVVDFFAARHFTLQISEDGGYVWAGLVGRAGVLVAPKYGRGTSPADAAESAKHRYLVEE